VWREWSGLGGGAARQGEDAEEQDGARDHVRERQGRGGRAEGVTVYGPTSWPTANAAVIAATSRGAASPATRRPSCSPVIVTTMKVPPTQSAQRSRVATLVRSAGRSTPAAITTCARAQTLRGGAWRHQRPVATVEAAAASPNTGHVQPNTAGSGTSSRAAAGRNVAGTMYPKPNAP
jgi:hypothetical protein